MDEQRERVGGSGANPIFRIWERNAGHPREKFVVGETGVAFDTLEAAEGAARELDGLSAPAPR
ncbi:MAG TPA: hypothetical protein VGC74_00730 [Stenotrophomonas sp.]|jgi:hypothetical protein